MSPLLRIARAPLGAALLAVAVACRERGTAAQAGPPIAPPTVAPALRKCGIEIVPPERNIGILEPNVEVTTEFDVVNRTNRPLSITKIAHGCKCLKSEYSKADVPPGGSTRVKVFLRSQSSGMRTLATSVQVNDVGNSSAEFLLRYSLMPEVQLQPPLIDFGTPKMGERVTRDVLVRVHIPPELAAVPKLAPFMGSSIPVELALDEPVITPETSGERVLTTTLHATIDTSRPLEPFETWVVFQSPEHLHRYTQLLVRGAVHATWYFEHEKLSFGVVKAGSTTPRSVRFYFPADRAAEVKTIEIDKPEFTATSEAEPDRHCIRLDVLCAPKTAGVLDGTLKLTTSLSDLPVSLRLNARVK